MHHHVSAQNGCDALAGHQSTRTRSTGRLLCRSRRSAIHDVKVIAMTEDNGTVRNLSCAQLCDLRCGVTLCRSLSDLEIFHIDIYALIARKLSDDVLSARSPIVGEASHQG